MELRPIFVALLLVICPLFLRAAPAGGYSDPTGVYALIDKVVLEPNTDAPERIQVWGAFAFASQDDVTRYSAPAVGYLYFSCKPGKEEVCRKEWADLKASAGSGDVIGFGRRYAPLPRARKADDKPTDPDEYPINFGLVKMSERNTDYPPVRALKSLPRRGR
jgi:hypothetical protein